MICLSFLINVLILHSTQAIGKHGCLLEPQSCQPPSQMCINDGYTGDCVSSGYDWRDNKFHSSNSKHQLDDTIGQNGISSEYYIRLIKLARDVLNYLHSRNIELSDLSETELHQIVSAMTQIMRQEATERERFLLLIKSAKDSLSRHGIKYSQLSADQKKKLIDIIVKHFLNNRDSAIRSVQHTAPHEKTNTAAENTSSGRPKPSANHSTLKSDELESRGSSSVIAPMLDEEAPPNDDSLIFKHKDDGVAGKDDGGAGKANKSLNPHNMMFPGNDVSIEKKDDSNGESIRSQNAPSVEDLSRGNVEFAEKTNHKSQHGPDAVADDEATYIIVIVVVTIVVVCIVVIAVAIYCMRSSKARDKLLGSTSVIQSGEDYQALCRQHYASKSSEPSDMKQPLISSSEPSSSAVPTRVFSPTTHSRNRSGKGSRDSSLSSWCEEPITTSLDISTGHAVLTYMEDHLNNKDRLRLEWDNLCNYKADNVSSKAATDNSTKNRSQYAVPYDHNRVKLNVSNNPMESDYINASFIIDNDPRCPLYIATQGPLSSTIHHFWQMVWEQGCVVIVMLAPLSEEGVSQCARYWPDEGSSTYDNYEIHLVSEHIWCEDYLVRSLYLKNLESGETRTVTQFHFLSWPCNGIPSSSKPLLELRRKVSKCYRGNSVSPVLVHCSDGCGRTGSYILLDLVIARMVKGTCKEIDIAATLEHLRDQRAGGMVNSKEQLEFALACVADEVNAMLRVLVQ